MAHGIDHTTGRAAMAYVGKAPWHGLGTKLSAGTPVNEWPQAAGLNWNAILSPVLYRDDKNEIREFGEDRVLYRSDTKAPLAIVSDNYKVVQPSEVLDFYRGLAELAGFQLDTAGALLGGSKVWALARRDLAWSIGATDRIEGYLLLATSFDMSLATTALLTSVRVVCQNTLSIALGEIGAVGVKIAHNRVFDADETKRKLNVIDPAWARFRKQVEILVATTVAETAVRGYFERVAFPNLKPKEIGGARKAAIDLMINDYRSAPGQDLPTARGTAWGLVNAVTHYLDHTKRAANAEARMDAACFGAAQPLKERAWKEALAIAGT